MQSVANVRGCWSNRLAALLAAVALLGCHGADWGGAAPFDAPPAPEEYTPPEPTEPVIGPVEAAADAAPQLATHIHGDSTWPCTGHPACAEASPADQTVGVSVGSVEFLDPALITETEGSFVVVNLFEGLIMPPRRSGLPWEAGVATGYRLAADGVTYTFTLRPDARWSDGSPVVAEDFVYSFLRKLDPATGSVAVEPLYWIANAEAFNRGTITDPSEVGVKALDDHTLVITLAQPTPFWLNYVATSHYRPVPRQAIEAHGRQWTRPENIVTNGPYHLVEFDPRDRIRLVKSDTYWDKDNVRIPQVQLYHSASESQDETRYNAGQIHWARMGVSPSRIPGLIAERSPDLFIDPMICHYHYVFNTERPPFDDVRVRRAFDMAIDKARLVAHVTQSLEIPADGMVLPHFEDTLGYARHAGNPYDPTAARGLLAEAGYAGGRGMPKITLVYNTLERHKLIAEFVQRSLRENLGVAVELENMEFKSLLKKVRAGDFQMSRRGWCGIEHPYSLLEIWTSDSPRNASGFADPEFDRLLAESTRATTRAEEMALLAEAEAVLQREVPFAPVFYSSNPYLKKPVLRGLEVELTDTHPVKYMWWGDTQDPPEARVLEEIDERVAAATADGATDGDERLLDHLHGVSPSWPCAGHPVCDDASPADGMLGVDIGGMEFLDPSMISETEGFLVATNIFEGLANSPKRSGMPLEPGVAERWEVSDDGLVYTFHLRDDARWTNGRAVDAHDFVYALRRKIDPTTGSTAVEPLFLLKNARAFNQGTVQDIEEVGIRAIDDRTLELTLEMPTSFFMKYVVSGHYLPVPREAIEQHGKQWTRAENIVTNGPFRMTEWVPRSRITLVKNPDYWDADAVRLPGVILHVSDSHAQSNTRYQTNTIQWGRSAVGTADIEAMLQERRPDFFIDPYLCYYAYFFRNDRPPFDDVRVRRAVNMAIDKAGLVQHITRGMQVPADGPILPHFERTMGYPKPKGDPHDPDRARELLAEAGYPNGQGMPKITLVYNTFESHRLMAEYVQRNLREHLGVEVEIHNMEWKSLLQRLRTGNFQMARFGWCGIEHPFSLMSVLQSFHPENSMAYKSPEFDALIDRARRATDHAEEMRLYAEAEAIVQRDMPFSPIYYYTKTYLKRPVLQGLEPELTNSHLFKYMYWADR